MVQLEAVTSSLISHRGYDPEARIMYVRFAHKQFKNGSLYSYGNVSPDLYAAGCAHVSDRTSELSFGQWFQIAIKPNGNEFPFRKIEDPNNHGPAEPQTLDFESGAPIPATTPDPLEELPEDKDALVAKAIELQDRVKAIVINCPEAYELATRTGIAIASMQKALVKAFYEGPDGITERHQNWKNAIAIFNNYNDPLESDKNRLKAGLSQYKREQDRIAQQAANAERDRLQAIEDQKARERAAELKKADIKQAIAEGDKQRAAEIKAAPAPIVPARYVPPQPVQSAAPATKGVAHAEKWVFEFVDERGEALSSPRYDLIPSEYLIVNEKAIAAVVRNTKGRTNIPGVRAYDEGSVRLTAAKK